MSIFNSFMLSRYIEENRAQELDRRCDADRDRIALPAYNFTWKHLFRW